MRMTSAMRRAGMEKVAMTGTAHMIFRAIGAEVYKTRLHVIVRLADGTQITLPSIAKANKLANVMLQKSRLKTSIKKNMPDALFCNNPVKVRTIDPRNGRVWAR